MTLDTRRVLVVDDDPFVLEILCFQLERLGHAPTAASSLAEGLAALASGPFDVVIADANLGVESSHPLLEAAAAAASITVTVSASPAATAARVHLTKPVSTDDLARALEVPVEHP